MASVTHHICRCFMTLIRGVNALFPCPVCLVPKDMLWKMAETFPLRTTESMKAVFEGAQNCRLAEEKDDLLKSSGLRDVQVRFKISFRVFTASL